MGEGVALRGLRPLWRLRRPQLIGSSCDVLELRAPCHARLLARSGAAAIGRRGHWQRGRRPRWRHVPVALLDAIAAGLGAAGRLVPALADKAELASIGRYYGTESMLVWDAVNGRYDEAATPSTGSDTLWDHYAALARGEALPERGDHAVF